MFVLGPNQLQRFYQGGAEIASFRGLGAAADGPEDWVASVTTAFGEQRAGLSSLPDGRMLADAIAESPEWFLGAEHVAAYGTDTGLLVKLLNAGQRLPVHCHPDQAYSRAHLGCAHGKTEAWIVLTTSAEDACVYLGFRDDIAAGVLAGWVASQDVPALVGALHRVPVGPGDSVLVPGGTPHAIGPGVFLAELQEPTDLSILLEWHGFLDDGTEAGSLGLGYPAVLAAVDRSGWSPGGLAGMCRRAGSPGTGGGITRLLPSAADPFFRAELLQPEGHLAVPAGYAVWIAAAGAGTLATEHGGTLPVRRGMTVLVPHADGAAQLTGDIQVIRCLPPS